MKRLRGKLTYSNVISTLCLFLLVGGGTAFAASQLGKNSVGSKQLKKNAVTAAKIKKNAITGAKIKSGAITGPKIKAGSVSGSNIAAGTISGANIAGGTITGANINAPSTPFTQVVSRLRSSAQQAFGTMSLMPVGSYTQQAGEDNQYLGSMTVNFASSCQGKREAEALLLRDVTSIPSSLETLYGHIAGVGIIEEESNSAATATMEFGPYIGFGSMSSMAPATATGHTFTILPILGECKTGSGITASSPAVDVLGTK